MSVMGKLNSSTEIIPIHGSADSRKDDLYRFKTNLKRKKQNSTYFSDPFIIPRVKQYLDENKHCDFIDTENITDVLQQRYREYSKRKRSAFKGLVEKAFRVILRSYNLEPGNMENFSGSSDDDIDPDDYHDIDDTNRANEKLMQLYMQSEKQKKNVSLRNEDKELINISSDEEDSNGKRERAEHKSKDSSNSPKLTIPSSTSIIRNLLPVSQGNCKHTSKPPPFSISVTPQQPMKSQSWNMPPYLKQQAGPTTSSASPLSDKPKKRKSTVDTGTGNHKRQREIAIHDSHINFANIGGMTTVLEANTTPFTKPQSANLMGANTQTPPQNLLQVKETSQKEQAVPSFSPKSNSKSTVKKQKSNVNTGELKLKSNREALVQDSHINFGNIGGIPQVLEEICKLLVHIRHPEIYDQIGVTPPRGFLLHGPPGCGKTLLAMAIAGELELPLLRVAAPELVGGIAGESEERIRDLFEQAVSLSPCILFLDEIDAITPNRMAAQREMERRIVAQLLSCLDELGQKEGGSGVLVIGATNRPDSLDPALRRAGRFDREVCLGIPNQESRSEILKVLCCKINMAPNFSYETVAKNTPGFVGADLMALMREAAMAAVNRVFNELRNTKSNTNLSEQPECSTTTVEQGNTVNDCEIEELSVIETESNPKERGDLTDNEITIDDENTIPNKNESYKKENKEANSDIETENSKTSGITLTDNCKTDEKTVCSGVESVNSDKDDAISKHMCNINDVTQNNLTMADVNDENGATKTDHKLTSLNSKETSLVDLLDWLHKQAPLNKEQLKELHIQQSDFDEALKVVQPSAKREGFATVPDVTWDDVGSLQDVREELQLSFLAPIRHPKEFADLGLTMPTGVLLCGPPGCGKTLLAKAVANEAGINFISVKGPELLNMYVGESERAVRQCFQRAKNSAPCVIFFDELDSLCPKRSDSREGGASRVVNQMLTEMDGLEARKGVFLLAATNRPDIVDPAVLRPGRLDKILYVGLPGPEDRAEILNALTKQGEQPCLDKDVSLDAIAQSKECEGYTGADLAALVREACVEAFKDFLLEVPKLSKPVVGRKHFMKALAKIRPSVPEKDLKHYEKLRKIYSVKPCAIPVINMDIAESHNEDKRI